MNNFVFNNKPKIPYRQENRLVYGQIGHQGVLTLTAGSPVSAKSQVTTKDLIIVCVCFQSEPWNIFNEIYLVQKNAD